MKRSDYIEPGDESSQPLIIEHDSDLEERINTKFRKRRLKRQLDNNQNTPNQEKAYMILMIVLIISAISVLTIFLAEFYSIFKFFRFLVKLPHFFCWHAERLNQDAARNFTICQNYTFSNFKNNASLLKEKYVYT